MSNPIIQILDITKKYVIGTEEINALNGVSLEVQKNEYVALMGH